MKRQEKADRIQEILDELYPETPVPLDHTDPFTLLVAVLLSAQTTDARVNLCTPELFRRGPDPRTMAALTVEEILEPIRTCGLAPTKAKNLKKLAGMLVEEHDGEVPADFEELAELDLARAVGVVLGQHRLGLARVHLQRL